MCELAFDAVEKRHGNGMLCVNRPLLCSEGLLRSVRRITSKAVFREQSIGLSLALVSLVPSLYLT
jgi:hypothetical protein